MEECLDSGEACPLIPHGPKHYESKCVQKFTYQRMLVYDPYDKYLPFAVEVSTVSYDGTHSNEFSKKKNLNFFG